MFGPEHAVSVGQTVLSAVACSFRVRCHGSFFSDEGTHSTLRLSLLSLTDLDLYFPPGSADNQDVHGYL
jgi:hypothetical protein